MPQMAPLKWLFMFILFSLTFMIFNILNYYTNTLNFSNNSEKNLNENKTISINWKW
uniref:ATP synthase complex subunit 8 n=1 Tax=Brillia brevicornis TaxID=2970799 RepID=A0A976UF75_9DIPT|nr:ATP synthase F0 subunit 8 [Brillia brevicornis]UVG40806.1 ATP synthase F0 subunit 8 [Brillia brevicornis]